MYVQNNCVFFFEVYVNQGLLSEIVKMEIIKIYMDNFISWNNL